MIPTCPVTFNLFLAFGGELSYLSTRHLFRLIAVIGLNLFLLRSLAIK
jgi:hypothetical protein